MSSGAMVEIFMILTPVVQMVSRNQHPWGDIQLEEVGLVPMTGQVMFGNGLQMNLGITLQIPRPEWINQYPQILTLPGGSWGYPPAFSQSISRYPVPPEADYLAAGFPCAVSLNE